MNIQRREFLGSIIGAGLVAGCATDYPATRILDMQHVNVDNADSTWRAEVTVRIRNHLDPGGFHNVTVTGYSDSAAKVCSEQLGKMAIGVEIATKTVTMDCSARPVLFGLEAAETPCDENTIISAFEYNESQKMWRNHELKCGGGLQFG